MFDYTDLSFVIMSGEAYDCIPIKFSEEQIEQVDICVNSWSEILDFRLVPRQSFPYPP